MASLLPLGPGLHVLERGWLSSNNVLLDSGDGATLVDSGHCVHAEQTVALLRQRLGEQPLRELDQHPPAFRPLRRQCRAAARMALLDVRVPSGSFAGGAGLGRSRR